jgi:DNA-binding winged helix-turn-helix (wHTH) protein/tetratricopeptide (TPR) repeat protein/TolB-like protein
LHDHFMTSNSRAVKDIKNNDLKNELYRFGDYVLHAGRRELSLRGEEIELQPRVFDLLVYLLHHRDRAVDKDELLDAVWPGMVITETALTRAVMKARKAVGDDAATQSVIKTLHGHGYRFVAAVEVEADEAPGYEIPVTGPEPSAPEIPARPKPWSLPAISAAIAAIALIALAAGYYLRAPQVEPGETRLAVLPLNDRTGDPEMAWTTLGLMSLVSKMLGSEGELALLADGSVVSLADSFGWNGTLEGAGNAALLDRLREIYGVSHVLAMTLEKDGSLLRMNYGLLDADDRLRRGTMVGSDGTELARGVVQGVYGLLLRRSRLDTETPLISSDPFNNEAYARGMSLSLEGRCKEAVQFFRVIAEQEPTLFAPRLELAACLRILGRIDEAEPLLLQLVEEQAPLGSSKPLAQSMMTLGILYNRSGRIDEAEAMHQKALAAAREIDDPELAARVLQNLAIVAEDRNDWEGSAEFLDLAMLEYQRAGRETLPGQLYSAYANLKMDQGELAQAEDYLEQALNAFREVGDRRNEAMMLNNTGYLRRLQGRLEEAENYHLRSLEIREEIGDRVGVGRIYGMLAVVHLGLGRYAEAKTSAQAAVEIARETRDRLFEGTSLAQLGDAEKALGDPASARGHYLEGRAVFEAIQDRMRVLQSDLKLAGLDLIEEQYDAAWDTAYRVLPESRELTLIQPEVQAMELLGDVAAARGDIIAAVDEYSAALDRVRESSWTAKENTLMWKLAGAHMDLGDLESAAPLIGALSRQTDNEEALRARARYAWLNGEAATAVLHMEAARELAGDAWDNENEATLQRYREGQ